MKRPPEDYLGTEHLDDDLRGRSVSGAFVTLGAQAVKFALHLLSVTVLARILMPADFGLVGMVTALTGLVVLFKDLGLSTATVQRQEVHHDQVSTLFWFNFVLSAAAMLLVAAAAPLVAWLYGEPRLVGITLAISAAILLGGLAVQHQALLRRQMRFGRLSAVEIAAQAGALLAALGAALAGAGYWALVVQAIAQAAVYTAGCWFACGWRPTRPVRGSGVRPMLRFGGHLTAFNLLNYLARNLDDMLIGRFSGAAALGFYNRAYVLLMLPVSQVNAPIAAIAVPTLSRLQQQGERFRRYYLQAVGAIAWITMPAIAVLAVVSDELVRLVLGERWAAVGLLFRIFAAAALINPVVQTSGWLFVALGQTERMARWGLLFATLRCSAFAVGLPWGATGVAVAYTVAAWVLALPILSVATRHAPVRLGEIGSRIARPLAAAATLAAGALAGRLAGGEALGPSLLSAAAGAGLGGLLLLAFPAIRVDIANLWNLRREWRR